MENNSPCRTCRYEYLLARERELGLSKRNADILIPSYAQFMKLAAGRLKWKFENHIEKKKKRPNGEIVLVDADIKSLHILQGKIEQYLERKSIDIANHPIMKAWFPHANEANALNYFENNLSEKSFSDSFGEKINIPFESFQFLYKENETGKHIVDSKNYVLERGQRLPYILWVLRTSKCILERPYRYDPDGTIDRMYLHGFAEKFGLDSREIMVYMAVIVLRDRKKNKPTKFKTAFPVVGEMDLCRRLSGGYLFVEK